MNFYTVIHVNNVVTCLVLFSFFFFSYFSPLRTEFELQILMSCRTRNSFNLINLISPLRWLGKLSERMDPILFYLFFFSFLFLYAKRIYLYIFVECFLFVIFHVPSYNFFVSTRIMTKINFKVPVVDE